MRFTKIAPPLVLAVICLTTAFVLHSTLTKNGEMPETRLTDSFPQSSGERGPVRMIRFVAFDEGLRPSGIRVRQGLINIAFEDKTDVSDGLQVERVVNDQREKVIHQKGYEDSNIMATSGGTKLKPNQIQEAPKNRSTKHCSVEKGITKCK